MTPQLFCIKILFHLSILLLFPKHFAANKSLDCFFFNAFNRDGLKYSNIISKAQRNKPQRSFQPVKAQRKMRNLIFLVSDVQCNFRNEQVETHRNANTRGGVEDTRLEAKAKAKDTKKIRGQGQGQGQPFRGQTLSRPRTGMLRKPRTQSASAERQFCTKLKRNLTSAIEISLRNANTAFFAILNKKKADSLLKKADIYR